MLNLLAKEIDMTIVQIAPLLTEELFQYIWKHRLFTISNLHTIDGEAVHLLQQGVLNSNDGPDFSNSRLRIGNTIWAGNVELHLKTSDWYRHNHQRDLRYRNVILHVVFEHDLEETTTQGIPILELQSAIPKMLLHRYAKLKHSGDFVPCAGNVAAVERLTWRSWKDRLLVERMEKRADMMKEWLKKSHNNWEECCYWAIAYSYGMPVNGEAFLRLAQSLPYTMLMRNKHNLAQLEALLFGQAGMLEGPFTDEYPLDLQAEYSFLKRKYHLLSLLPHQWRWLRMRPSSFPSVRLASLAVLIQQGRDLFARLLEMKDLQQFQQVLFVQPEGYWKDHYRFDTPAVIMRRPGIMVTRNVIINSILPLLYLYGREKRLPEYQERALGMMETLPAEENSVMEGWKKVGVLAGDAADSQALLQLKQYYCEEKRCLQCAIGCKLLRTGIAL